MNTLNLLTAVFHAARLECDVSAEAEGDAILGRNRVETDSEVVGRTDGSGVGKTG